METLMFLLNMHKAKSGLLAIHRVAGGYTVLGLAGYADCFQTEKMPSREGQKTIYIIFIACKWKKCLLYYEPDSKLDKSVSGAGEPPAR